MPLPGQSAQIDFPELTADCSRCAALCCVAYPFEEDEDFAILKETDHPCPNLSPSCFNCTIHADLSARGFGGCIAYSCAGAGQRVTEVLFQGETWRDDPDLLPHMTHALRVLRPIHEALLILQEAAALSLPDALRAEVTRLSETLAVRDGTSIWDFEEPEVQAALAQVPEFVPRLAPYVVPRG
ncbi:hypothetical protein D1820_04530 [Phaeobacter sp. LSS9]|uniref:hypothetical protein n=1 Tax=unclassified Phaeobacter TaxID=2621772 RepID=UPI000E4C0341|nr:hypothetical protein [Phaeobacter sp. LSS9]AXT34299.1 hypothetical protein D1820_04530 [Phaeobacter sp. LSS9]